MMFLAAVGIIMLAILIWAIHWSTSLLVSSSCSWWHRNWQTTTVASLFVASGAILLIALTNDCRYSCQQWQSTGLDILATLASFSMGMILTGALDSATMSLSDWAKGGLWLAALLVVATVLILSPLSDLTPNSVAIFIWALGLPVLGIAGKRLWPWLF